jgi:K+-sensing histidine kinase KdpD
MEALRRRPREPEDGSDVIGLAVGVLGALALSIAMIPLRDHLHNDNMALALVVPVLIGGVIGGRRAGALSAAAAALCFDFFFTQPYLSLRIASSNDIASAVVLLVVALISAEVGIRARRGSHSARDSRADLDRLYRVIDLAARGDDIDDVISSAQAELIGLFGLADCAFETTPSQLDRPRLGNRGAIEGTQLVATHTDFLLPPGGVELPVVGRGREFGRLVLFAAEPVRASLQQRLVAVAIADELGITLATRSVS